MSRKKVKAQVELEARLRFETLVGDLSLRFVHLPASEVDGAIRESERRICDFLGLDFAALWQRSEEAPDLMVVTHFYAAQDGPRPPKVMNAQESFPWALQLVLAGRTLALGSLTELPAEAARDRDSARRLGIKSNVTLPLLVEGERAIGALVFNTTQVERHWPESTVRRLQLIAQIFAKALVQKRAEETQRASEARLAAGVDLAGLGYYEVDFVRNAGFTDQRLQDICGLTPGQHEDLQFLQFWMDHVHPDDLPWILDERQKLHAGRIKEISTEYRYFHPTQGQKWIHHLARIAERNAAGRSLRSFGVMRDITAQKEAEAEARELRDNLTHLSRVNTLGALSGSLAHELNQPLGIILSNAQAAQELLAQQPPDVAEVQAILTDIIAADRRAGSVIERLRALLKRERHSLQPLQLNQVIEEVLHLARADLIGRGVTVVCELASDLPPVAGDRVQLQQLLLNLIINAADAMSANEPGTRRLHIKSRPRDGLVRVSVRDEGCGLPAHPERLFQPFMTTKTHGLGLGLTICRSVASAHQGRIWAAPHPERGAVFTVDLPPLETAPPP